MKKASFFYEGIERITGKIVVNWKGEVKVTFPNSRKIRFKDKHYGKELAMEIVAANFDHPNAYNVIFADNHNLHRDIVYALNDFYHHLYSLTESYHLEQWNEIESVFSMSKGGRYAFFGLPHESFGDDAKLINQPIENREYHNKVLLMNRMQADFNRGKEGYMKKAIEKFHKIYKQNVENVCTKLFEKGLDNESGYTLSAGKIGDNVEINIYHNEKVSRIVASMTYGGKKQPHMRFLTKI